ncbi:MAG: amidohydrolase family protein [Pirellula sp.]|nr:amidohydrolase family protein [Pirellula sp.]
MRIDSHQHFWIYSESEYPWIPMGSTLHRDYGPDDLQQVAQPLGFDGSIAVQARQSVNENLFLSRLAEECDFIKGIVGWIDLRSPHVDSQTRSFARLPKAVGVRHVVQDESDPNFMAGSEFRRGIATLHQHGLVYDILIYAHQLPDAIRLVNEMPDQTFVLDHVAKPAIRSGEFANWKNDMSAMAKLPNVCVKLSGILTEADHKTWTVEQLRPYWDVVCELYAPSRILYGSDWPVIRLAAEYREWVEIVVDWLAPYSQSDQDLIWGGNAERIYLQRLSQNS